jgi:hypothetical protein
MEGNDTSAVMEVPASAQDTPSFTDEQIAQAREAYDSQFDEAGNEKVPALSSEDARDDAPKADADPAKDSPPEDAPQDDKPQSDYAKKKAEKDAARLDKTWTNSNKLKDEAQAILEEARRERAQWRAEQEANKPKPERMWTDPATGQKYPLREIKELMQRAEADGDTATALAAAKALAGTLESVPASNALDPQAWQESVARQTARHPFLNDANHPISQTVMGVLESYKQASNDPNLTGPDAVIKQAIDATGFDGVAILGGLMHDIREAARVAQEWQADSAAKDAELERLRGENESLKAKILPGSSFIGRNGPTELRGEALIEAARDQYIRDHGGD